MRRHVIGRPIAIGMVVAAIGPQVVQMVLVGFLLLRREKETAARIVEVTVGPLRHAAFLKRLRSCTQSLAHAFGFTDLLPLLADILSCSALRLLGFLIFLLFGLRWRTVER